MMQACCERIAVPQSPRPSGCASLADITAPARAGGGRTGGGDDVEKIAVGLYQRDGGRGKLAAFRRRFAHQFEQLRPRSRADDRLVGRAQRRQHARQALLLHLGPRLVVGAIEILQRERDVVGESLQQLRRIRA